MPGSFHRGAEIGFWKRRPSFQTQIKMDKIQTQYEVSPQIL